MAMQKLSFQWDINDYYDCDLICNEFFDSPRLSIPDSTFKSEWKLRLYPAGYYISRFIFGARKNLSILLLRLDSGSTFETKLSISLLNRNKSRIHTENSSEPSWEPMRFTATTDEILEESDIVEIQKNSLSYMDVGVLSVLCEIEIYEKSEDIDAAVPEKSLHMRGSSWVIRNIQDPSDITVKSGVGSKFCLPYGKLPICFQACFHSGYLSLQIIDNVYPEVKEVPVTIVYDDKRSDWNVKRADTVLTSIMYKKPDVSFKISTRCMVESTTDAFLTDTTCVPKMQKDFQNIFSQSEGADISIAVDGKVLHVHRNILSGRCPVFAAMFNHEWQEKITQTVNIKDFDHKTILAMIEFIYFGGSDDYYEANAADPAELLKAAHMYQLDDLKDKCEQRLCQRLEKGNVKSYTELAYEYNLQNLKAEAMLFKGRNHIL